MTSFDIVAHRGAHIDLPENSLAAFQKAISMGADSVEFDVRLTKNSVPIVYHYFYLDEITPINGPIFNYTFEELRRAQRDYDDAGQADRFIIPTLREVLEEIGGKIGLEIEIKGPEPEAPAMIGKVIQDYRSIWDTIELTSYEPQLLVSVQQECPEIPVDLLFPRSEPWMGLDVVAYSALQRARLANARAVHLHPMQLSVDVIEFIRHAGLEIHAWDVNDERALDLVAEYRIPNVCTDRLTQALIYRSHLPSKDNKDPSR